MSVFCLLGRLRACRSYVHSCFCTPGGLTSACHDTHDSVTHDIDKSGFEKGWVTHGKERKGHGPTICNREPSVLLFHFEITETSSLCFVLSGHITFVFARLILFDIRVLGWRGCHHV